MGYYLPNDETKKDTININENGICTDENGSLIEKNIEIVNNEEIKFIFNQYLQINISGVITTEENKTLEEENDNLIYLESTYLHSSDVLYKITIDYGDGSKETLNRPFRYYPDWAQTTHKFTFDSQKTSDTIKLKLYDLYGNISSINIEFKVKKQNFADLGIKLELLAANIDNNGKISYVFNDKNKNQLFLAKYRNS